jgi:hypothetical protein
VTPVFESVTPVFETQRSIKAVSAQSQDIFTASASMNTMRL